MKDGQGTLGGWVEVKNRKSGNWIPFALTCSHCCFPADDGLTAVDLQVVQKWKRHGVRPGDADSTRLLSVDSPSYRDIKRRVDSLAHDIREEESKEVYREVKELKANDEFVMLLSERRWKVISTAIAQLQGGRHIIKQFFHKPTQKLGTVFAASGFREMQSTNDPSKLSIRDWALVQPGVGRAAGKNTVTIPPAHRPRNWSHGTCKITTRVINEKEAQIPTWEHVMLWPGHLVTQEGDSGSLAFDSDGVVLGMLFGGMGTHDVGYFTATRDLLADIEHITGAKEIRLRYDDSYDEN
ncbi:hypothetical protein BJX99DRAFT_258822 [Aspergillus californicus]